MARTSSAAVLAALLAVTPATALLAQTAGATTDAPAATAPAATPAVVPPAADAANAAAAAASDAASTAADAAATAGDAAGNATGAAAGAANESASAAADAANATADAAATAADAAAAAGAAATDAATGTAPAADATAAAPAAPANPDQQIGAYYTKATHNAWTLRCLRTPDGKDPCELYQLLKDSTGKAVAEVSVIPYAGEAAAIMNFVAPLETDLEAGLGLQIDAGKNNRYPFLVCAPVGCVSRLGMTNAELDSLKRGNKATLSLLPFGADPANLVRLDMSLGGFTAGFTELQKVVQESQAAAQPAAPASN